MSAYDPKRTCSRCYSYIYYEDVGMNGLKDLNDCYFLTGRVEPMLGHSQPQ
jgi:hypothetical protein